MRYFAGYNIFDTKVINPGFAAKSNPQFHQSVSFLDFAAAELGKEQGWVPAVEGKKVEPFKKKAEAL